MVYRQNKMQTDEQFFSIFQSRHGSISFNNNNYANFAANEEYNDASWGMYFLSNLILLLVIKLLLISIGFFHDVSPYRSCLYHS